MFWRLGCRTQLRLNLPCGTYKMVRMISFGITVTNQEALGHTISTSRIIPMALSVFMSICIMLMTMYSVLARMSRFVSRIYAKACRFLSLLLKETQ